MYCAMCVRKGRTTSAEPFLYITSFVLNLQRWPLPFQLTHSPFLVLFPNHSRYKSLWLERSKRLLINRFLFVWKYFQINMLGFCEWLVVSVCLLAPKGSFITWLDVATAQIERMYSEKKSQQQRITMLARALLVALLYLPLIHRVRLRATILSDTHPLFKPIKD